MNITRYFLKAEDSQGHKGFVPLWIPSSANFDVVTPLGFTADQMRAFADATYATPASHWQAPAGATVDEVFLRSVVMLCNNKGASPESIENFDSDNKWIADLWRLAEQMLRKAPQPSPTAQAAQAADKAAEAQAAKQQEQLI